MIRRFAQASSACSLIKEVLDLLMVLLQHGEEQDPQNNPIVGLPYLACGERFPKGNRGARVFACVLVVPPVSYAGTRSASGLRGFRGKGYSSRLVQPACCVLIVYPLA